MILWHFMESTWVGEWKGTFNRIGSMFYVSRTHQNLHQHQTHMEDSSIANWTDWKRHKCKWTEKKASKTELNRTNQAGKEMNRT